MRHRLLRAVQIKACCQESQKDVLFGHGMFSTERRGHSKDKAGILSAVVWRSASLNGGGGARRGDLAGGAASVPSGEGASADLALAA